MAQARALRVRGPGRLPKGPGVRQTHGRAAEQSEVRRQGRAAPPGVYDAVNAPWLGPAHVQRPSVTAGAPSNLARAGALGFCWPCEACARVPRGNSGVMPGRYPIIAHYLAPLVVALYRMWEDRPRCCRLAWARCGNSPAGRHVPFVTNIFAYMSESHGQYLFSPPPCLAGQGPERPADDTATFRRKPHLVRHAAQQAMGHARRA
mmetsp:Transcript_4859/g.16192  ORF Transcript_4859/g.16192 Transcript_4859/m.16192 type:complete len:205 (-) Transcript_4859:1401-2015(-)